MDLIPYALACAATYSGVAPTFEDTDKHTHVYLSAMDGRPLFAFEGTRRSLEEWVMHDFMVLELSTIQHHEFGFLHGGIANGAFGIIDQLTSRLGALGWPAYDLAGHSKGAGEVWIVAAEMKRRGHAPQFVAAFEAPHVGGSKLRAYCADIPGAETSTVNSHGRDIVTIVPWATPILDWMSVKDRLSLPVPDIYDVVTKHRIPAVIDALNALPTT